MMRKILALIILIPFVTIYGILLSPFILFGWALEQFGYL